MTGAVVLGLIGIAAIIVELFVPAGGLIGLVGAGSIITAIVRTYRQQGAEEGTIFLLVSLVLVPSIIVLWFRIFPGTRIGKRLILGDSRTEDKTEPGLEGKKGTALTPLRPSGTALIEGRHCSVVTDGIFLEKGETVMVKKVEGNRIVVRKGAE
jgi:membrane-bound serine protease (ClpP class)